MTGLPEQWRPAVTRVRPRAVAAHFRGASYGREVLAGQEGQEDTENRDDAKREGGQ